MGNLERVGVLVVVVAIVAILFNPHIEIGREPEGSDPSSSMTQSSQRDDGANSGGAAEEPIVEDEDASAQDERPAASRAASRPPDVTGRVVGPDGVPVFGARLDARSGDRPAGEVQFVGVGSLLDGTRARRTDGVRASGPTVYTRPDGTFSIDEVADEDARIVVVHSEEWAPVAPIPVQRGARDVLITLRPAARPTLTVLDADGKPVRTTVVVEGDVHPDGFRRWVTGDDGRVTLGAMAPDETYRLLVRAPGRTDVAFSEIGWTPHDATVRLSGPLSIRGVVRDENGEPVPWALVEGAGLKAQFTDANGAFVFMQSPNAVVQLHASVLRPMRVSLDSGVVRMGSSQRLRQTKDGMYVVDDDESLSSVDAAAGAQAVELRVTVGAQVVVRVEGDRRLVSAATFCTLIAEDETGAASARRLALERDGTSIFRHVDADARYTVWVHDPEKGRFAMRTGVRAPAAVALEMVDGREIRVTTRQPDDVGQLEARLSLGRLIVPLASASGGFVGRGLPDGMWHIVVLGSRRKPWQRWHGEADVAAGGVVEVDLRPDAPK